MNSSHQDQNIKLVRRLFKGVLEINHIALYDHFFEKSIRIHGPFSDQDDVYDISIGKEFDLWLANNFIKEKFDLQEIFAHEDKVVVYWVLHCKHPKQVAVSGTSMYRLANGKICEVWQSWDVSILSTFIGSEHKFTSLSQCLEKISHEYKIPELEKYRQQALLLSKRERDCLHELLQGKTAKETAKILKLSFRTIEYYYENLKLKLDCSTKRELFTKAKLI